MTRDEFLQCFHHCTVSFHSKHGKKASRVLLGPDALHGLKQVVAYTMMIKMSVGESTSLSDGDSHGVFHGYPLFPMKANGVAAV